MTTPPRISRTTRPIFTGATLACALLASLPAVAVPPNDATADEAVGVLLFSPTERLAIERRRSGDMPAASVPPDSVQFDGMVRRERGKTTVWLNNRPQPEGQAGLLKQAPVVTATGIRVDGTPLRVGETLELKTGQRADFIPPGAVDVKRAP